MLKKIVTLVLIICVLGVCALGCGAPAEPQQSEEPGFKPVTPENTPEPTPEPEGLLKIFGKSAVTVGIVCEDEAEAGFFIYAAEKDAAALGIDTKVFAGASALDNCISDGVDAVLAYRPGSELDWSAYKGMSIPAAAYVTDTAGVPENVAVIAAEETDEIALLVQAAFEFPPHEAPVRMLFMCEEKGSPLDLASDTLYDEGKLYRRGSFYAKKPAEEEEETPADPAAWLNARLEEYPEGMVDVLVAENSELALSAIAVMEAAARDDFEIMVKGFHPDFAASMQKNYRLAAVATGVNTAEAGTIALRMALLTLYGEPAPIEYIAPSLIYSEKLKDAGDIAEALTDIEVLPEIYSPAWIDELKAAAEK